MEMIEEFAKDVSNFLVIECPAISFDSSKLRSKTQMAALFNGVLYLKEGIKEDYNLFFAIAHELRHVWQLQNDEDFYFGNYKPRPELDLESYNLQPAEIDANAFAGLVMEECFGIEILFNGMSDIVKAKIYARMNYLDEKLFGAVYE